MKVFYIRDKSGLPIATVASELNNGVVDFAVSAYNPRDVFDKALGRKIAEQRLQSGSVFASFDVPNDKTVKLTILGALAIFHESNTVRDNARRMLKERGVNLVKSLEQ